MREKRQGRRRRGQRGSVLPAVLALTIGVGALTTGYFMRNAREHGRETFDRASTMSLYDAWAQMEVVTSLINASDYDGNGRNLALQRALARDDDQFIDADGWPTNVTVSEEGGAGSGFYDLVSVARVGDAESRVTALIRERQSFADFNYFVNSHPLGISGGQNPNFPYADAPEGSIHSNDRLVMYFPNRHFRDAVTAVSGFEYTAGARGRGDPDGQNNFFHGPHNDAAEEIGGLTDVDLAAFQSRPDILLNLYGDWDFAKVKLLGRDMKVEHWQVPHQEQQDVTTLEEAFHYETRDQWVPDYEWQNQPIRKTKTIYETQIQTFYKWKNVPELVTPGWSERVQKTRTDYDKVLVTAAWSEQVERTKTVYDQVLVSAAWSEQVERTRTVYDSVLVTAAWSEQVERTRTVTRQVWVEGGGGGDVGGGGSGDVGYWEWQTFQETYMETVNHPAEYEQVPREEQYTETVNHPAVFQNVPRVVTYMETVNHPAVFNSVPRTVTYWQDVWHPPVFRNVRTLVPYQKPVKVPVGVEVYYVDNWVQVPTGTYHNEPFQVRVSDGWNEVTSNVWVALPERKVRTYDLEANGTVYVKGDVQFQPMSVDAGDPYDVHVLDGAVTFASDDDILLQDSIVYGVTDGDGALQTAYRNGADRTQPYEPNDGYTGSSVLGIIARDEILYTSQMPDQSEINATMMAKVGQVAVQGVAVNDDGTVSEADDGWVKMSLRRLGGIVSNRRPVSAYVDGSNTVTRGFVFGKSVFDRRQLTNAPRGFPTLNRPRILATVLREVR